ncbi:MAG: hypothetical protein RLZZ347_760 [Candidatus Parcubacteria bacterium]
MTGHKREKQEARELLARENYSPLRVTAPHQALITQLPQNSVRVLDRKVKSGKHLSFDEAFCGMCIVLAATNQRVFEIVASQYEKAGIPFSHEYALTSGTAFMQLMAVKESLLHLTEEEIAGMVAASMMDIVVRFEWPEVIEMCGMGGDIGFGRNGSISKTINVSTLSSFVLSGLGLPIIKHGSYANTSAVGSTEAIEQLGANVTLTNRHEVEGLFKKGGFAYLDAHWCKTIHDLSHLLMMETVNHIIGPMTPPISPQTVLTKVMGVNEKVHPETIVRAYNILNQKGLVSVGGIVVVAGLSQYIAGDLGSREVIRSMTIMDELSPYGSVIALGFGGHFLGNVQVSPTDFGVTLNPDEIKVSNDKSSISSANESALSGKNLPLARYLAMNAALGLFAHTDLSRDMPRDKGWVLERLMSHTRTCLNSIASGDAHRACTRFVTTSREYAPSK